MCRKFEVVEANKMLISRFPNNNAEAKIVELENKFNISLPTQYRKFLCKYNGGDTPKTEYKAGRESSDLRAFYGFGEVRYSIDKLVDLPEWINNGIFPIACDSFGNYIAIGVNEDTYGKIYFADHEAGFEKSAIAGDFKEFTSKCKSRKISPDARATIEEREADLISRGRGHVIDDMLRQMWQEEIDKYGNMVQEELIVED